MRRMRRVLAGQMPLVLCVLGWLPVGSLAAQEPPDFTGQWVLVDSAVAPPDVPLELAVRHQFEPRFRVMFVDRYFKTGVRSARYEIGLAGGTIRGIDANGRGTGPNGQLPQTQFSTKWYGDRLVIETASYSGRTRESGPYTEHSEVWSLDAQGRLSIVVTDRSSAAEPKTTTLTYKKR